MQILLIIFVACALLGQISCNCGCLKCSKDLTIIPQSKCPCKVIYRNSAPTCCSKYYSFDVQAPLPPAIPSIPIPRILDYKVALPNYKIKYDVPTDCYSVTVQAPVIPPTPVTPPIFSNLYSCPDRVVIPTPPTVCPMYDNTKFELDNKCRSIWDNNEYGLGYPYGKVSVEVPSTSAPRPVFEEVPLEFLQENSKCGCKYEESGPIFSVLGQYPSQEVGCGCRYGNKRSKRALPLLTTFNRLILGILPHFIKFPIQQTLKTLHYQPPNNKVYKTKKDNNNYYQNHAAYRIIPQEEHKELTNYGKSILMRKLKKLSHERHKRSLFGSSELTLPFFQVKETDLDEEEYYNSDEESYDENYSTENEEKEGITHLLKPFNFPHLLPHNPALYVLNTPIRLLHHVRNLGQHVSPLLGVFPQILSNSRKCLRNMGRGVKSGVLNAYSNLVGDFDHTDSAEIEDLVVRPFNRRFRRSLQSSPLEKNQLIGNNSDSFLPLQYSGKDSVLLNKTAHQKLSVNNSVNYDFFPEYELAFEDFVEKLRKNRTRRYLVKVVDEDEVHDFIREKLSGGEAKNEEPKRPKGKSKKLILEKINSKIIIDKNGLPFLEINGNRRPIFPKRKKIVEKDNDDEKIKNNVITTELPEQRSEPTEDPEKKEIVKDKEEDIKEKINDIIEKAKEKLNKGENELHPGEVTTKVVRDKINQILLEIQNLINQDFNGYSKIYVDLVDLQSLKDYVVVDWKQTLIQERHNDIPSKIKVLDYFQQIQTVKDRALIKIAQILAEDGNNFMCKKLIKILVRLQKLQCIIAKVVEDFGEKIKMGANADINKEIKYVDYLDALNFVESRNKIELDNDLKKERNDALKKELKLLEYLRKIVENNDPKIYEIAQNLWEINNIEKLQKNSIKEMSEKISHNQKIRKELKILFDLLRQLENCEQKQEKFMGISTEETPPPSWGEQSKINHFSQMILEDKKPVKLVSNGYVLSAYKMDGFQ